jgi:hypothetical protein
MVRSSGHCHHYQSLEEDTDAEGVHGETGCVDLQSEQAENTLAISMLSATIAVRRKRSCDFRDVDLGLARPSRITCKDGAGRASSEIFKGDWDESTKAADYEDLCGK